MVRSSGLCILSHTAHGQGHPTKAGSQPSPAEGAVVPGVSPSHGKEPTILFFSLEACRNTVMLAPCVDTQATSQQLHLQSAWPVYCPFQPAGPCAVVPAGWGWASIIHSSFVTSFVSLDLLHI